MTDLTTEASPPAVRKPARHQGRAVALWVAVAVAVVALWYGLTRPPAVHVVMSVPGMDGRPAELPVRDVAHIGTIFEFGPGKPSNYPGTWPGFRGADFSNLAPAPKAPLASSWPTNGPQALWTATLGEGCAGAAVRNGRVYIMDYDESGRADMLRCLSLDDGREIWRRGYTIQVKRNHGMSRTVAAVSERHVVTIGPRGHVMCVEADSGRFLWGLDMERKLGARVPDWYTGQCPLIDGEVAVLAPCGTNVFMMGVECSTGRTLWETPPPGAWKMSHSSVAPAVIAGRRMYVYAAIGGMAGVAADGADRGRILWQTSEWRASVIAPTPVVMPEGRIFVTAGYGAGGMVFQVSREGEKYVVKTVRKFNPRNGLACEQHTPLFYQGRLFGVLPKDAGPRHNEFACADVDGNILWTSGTDIRFGIGPFMIVGDRLLVLDDEGVLTMARMDRERFIPMARARVLPGQDSWAPMALVGTRLLVRDFKHMVCLELGEKGRTP